MTLRLAHFSDIHVTVDPSRLTWRHLLSKRAVGWLNLRMGGRWERLRDAARRTRALVDDLLELHPDHILFTGDLTGLSLPEEFDAAADALAPLLAAERISRITGIPGNHDVYVRSALREGSYARRFAAWEASDREPSPPILRLLGSEVALIVLRDSRPTAPWDSSGRVGARQLERLRATLELPDVRERTKILALHYGLRRADGSSDTRLHGLRDADAVLDAAWRGGVDLIVHGHLHRRFVLWPGDATPVAIADPGSATWSAGNCAYHQIIVEGRSLRLEARRWNEASGRYEAWLEAPGAGPIPPPRART